MLTRRLFAPLTALLLSAPCLTLAQTDSFLSTTTLSSDDATTISLSGVERIRIQPDGAGIYFAFWPNQTNDEIGEVASVATQPGSNDKVALLTVTGTAKLWNGAAVEVRAADGTTVKARGVVKAVSAFTGLTPYYRRPNTGSNTIINVVLGTAPTTPLAATDTLYFLEPDRTDKLGVYLPDDADAGGGWIMQVPGPVQSGGVLVVTRAAASTTTVHVSAYFQPSGQN